MSKSLAQMRLICESTAQRNLAQGRIRLQHALRR
jgi:hypothetical protein